MSIRAPVKTQVESLPRSSAELAAEDEKLAAAYHSVVAEIDELRAGEQQAARSSVPDALFEHRQKIAKAEARRDSLALRMEEREKDRASGVQSAEQMALLNAYETNREEGDVWQKELQDIYSDLCRRLFELLLRGRDIQARRESIVNRNLPQGCQPLPDVEHFRRLPAEPDREEQYEVEEIVHEAGRLAVFGVGVEPPKTRKVMKTRLVIGHAVVIPPRLWECFQAAPLQPNGSPFLIRGARFVKLF